MQTSFSKEYLQTDEGQQADNILRSCVHCGFCTATCPTFLLTGNELDSPRGRIYLIKEMLEENTVSSITQFHLDRCLSCQSCETTCPSNVQYHSLLNIGKNYLEKKVKRSPFISIKHFFLRKFLVNTPLFNFCLKSAVIFKYLLPSKLRKSIGFIQKPGTWPSQEKKRKMVILNGCVQKSLSPNTNAAAARVLDKLNIQLLTLTNENCCGALSYHLNAQAEGLEQAKHNINLLCQQLDQGVEAIISSASGCGNFIKDYENLLITDDVYSEKSKRVVAKTKDLSEILAAENLQKLQLNIDKKLSFHCPCSLQHGQKLAGTTEKLLADLGFKLMLGEDPHICCGAAGTYAILQPELSQELQQNKVVALTAGQSDVIATANIGCQTHLSALSDRPVKHWIEYIDDALI